jgi:hypothetical protein
MRNAWRQLWRLSLLALVFAGSSHADEGLVLFGPDVTPVPIAYPTGQANDQKNAEILAKYLGHLSGATFTVTASETLPAAPVIAVGNFVPADGEGLTGEDFRLRVREGRLLLTGASSRARAYAVYHLLEAYLGCRWWSHSEESVPRQERLAVPALDLLRHPPFTLHSMMNIEFSSKANDFNTRILGSGTENFTGSHNLQPMLEGYSKTHPEILPQNAEGVRKFNNLHYCYLAPGIAEALTEALEKQIISRKGKVDGVIYFAGMGDWYGGMCECEACKAVYADEKWTDPDGREKPGYTATLLRLINTAAERLDAKYPGVRIGTFAYMSLEAPPAKTRPRANVAIRVPRLRHCTMHGADECDKNGTFRRNLERWCEITPGGVYIWDYGVSFKNFLYPFPCLNAMAANLKFYHKIGVKGVMIQSNYVTPGSDLVVLKNYVWRRLMWQPELKTADLLHEFCQGYYGPAADAMETYVTTMEAAVRQPEMIHADEFAGPGFLSPAARTAMAAQRVLALAAAGTTEPWARRVREGTASIEYLQLSNPGVLKADGAQWLASNAAPDRLTRAVALLADLRESGMTEWNNGKGAWQYFVASQGGPRVSLQAGDWQAELAVLNNGMIRQFTVAGQPLFFVPNPDSRGYPANGGSQLRAGNLIQRLVGTPSDSSVTMEDVFEAPGWRWASPKATMQRTFALDREGLTVSARPVKGSKPAGASVTTVYQLKQGGEGLQMAVAEADGTWRAVSFEVGKTDLTITGSPALRLAGPAMPSAIEDRFAAPEVKEWKLVLDEAGKRLTVTTSLTGFGPVAEDAPAPLRRQFRPIPQP